MLIVCVVGCLDSVDVFGNVLLLESGRDVVVEVDCRWKCLRKKEKFLKAGSGRQVAESLACLGSNDGSF